MNFFEHQDQARRNTGLLVLLFAVAVISLVVLTNLLLIAVLAYAHQIPLNDWRSVIGSFSWHSFVYIALGTCSVLLLASFCKYLELSGGGQAVAEAMGGRRINVNTRDANERKILNVVEEMAVASGTPVPPVYLFEEQGINAFAAGHDRRDAVIGITRGCVQLLERDELQGVIAHEFSHIFNGDMRLNLRLIMILHGILVIGIAGFHLLRAAAYGGHRRRSDKAQSTLPLLALSAGLIAIGYIGSFCGNLIKAAVSRQREFLADASAVQFTRNPRGIGGALMKIGGSNKGSAIDSPHAAELSHLFFGQAVTPFFNGLMATHPPLQQRIRRIQPEWDGSWPQLNSVAQRTTGPTASSHETVTAFSGGARDANTQGRELIASVGQPNAEGIVAARSFLQALPPPVMQAAHEPFGARALVYCLLLDENPQLRQKQWRRLEQTSDPEVYRLARMLESPCTQAAQNRLRLLDLCLPALKELNRAQYRLFKDNLVALIHADQQLALYEWALFQIIISNLEGGQRTVSSGRDASAPKSTAQAAALILSSIASSAASSEQQARTAFESGKAVLGIASIQYLDYRHYGLQNLSQALALLGRLKPLQKPGLLKALCAAAAHDGVVEPIEIELIRAVADSLDCPIPPQSLQ